MKNVWGVLLYLAIAPAMYSQVIAIKAGRLIDPKAGRSAANQNHSGRKRKNPSRWTESLAALRRHGD